jgi:tetratricopeptide (TPR) repeat protein
MTLVALSACAPTPAPAPQAPPPPPAPAKAACSPEAAKARALHDEAVAVARTDLSGAIARMDYASNLAPDDPGIAFELSELRARAEDWDGVLRATLRGLRVAPDAAPLWELRGRAGAALARKGTEPWTAAVEAFSRCVALDRHFTECLEGLSEAALFAGDEALAADAARGAIRGDPTRARGYLSLGDLYLRLGLVTEGETVLREAITRVPRGATELVTVRVLLAESLMDRGEITEAATELEAAKAAAPPEDQAMLLYSLGSVYARMTPPRKQEAIQNLTAFSKRACKGARAVRFRRECEVAQSIVTTLGSTLQ